jgi:hypothetical protein
LSAAADEVDALAALMPGLGRRVLPEGLCKARESELHHDVPEDLGQVQASTIDSVKDDRFGSDTEC